MSIKNAIMSLAVAGLRCLYAPMKPARSENKITIISRQSDEPTQDVALLSDYIRENHPDVECAVMCRKLEGTGKFAYALHMLSQMRSIAKSKVLVLDGYCIAASVLNHKPELKIVQMWHSMAAIKKFGYQALGTAEGRSSEVAEAMCMHKNYDYVIAPSEATAKLFCEGFNAEESRVKLMGLPRVDLIMDARKGTANLRDKLREEYSVSDKQEIILYAPTFRKSDEVDVHGLMDVIDEAKYKLIVKLHPLYDKEGVSDKRYSTFEWLEACDRIITDYSALGIEASLVNKPLYFYVYDIEEYSDKLGINIDPREEMPKASAKSAEDMVKLLESEYDWEELERFRNKYITIDTNNCTKRLGDFIYELSC